MSLLMLSKEVNQPMESKPYLYHFYQIFNDKKGRVVKIKAGLWLYTELRTVTQLLQMPALPPCQTYGENLHACSYWVRAHNSMYSQSLALIMMT